MNKVLYVLFASLVLTGCVSTTVIPTTTSPVQTLPPTQDVSIFLNESDVRVPFTVLGTIHHANPGKYQRLDLNDVIPVLKDKARSIGANGVIVDKQEQIVSGIVSRGIDVIARAIKF
jgi:hypothetical protein